MDAAQLQAPAPVMSWPRHYQQTACGGPCHKGVGDMVGPRQVQKGLRQPRLAGKAGERGQRGADTEGKGRGLGLPTAIEDEFIFVVSSENYSQTLFKRDAAR